MEWVVSVGVCHVTRLFRKSDIFIIEKVGVCPKIIWKRNFWSMGDLIRWLPSLSFVVETIVRTPTIAFLLQRFGRFGKHSIGKNVSEVCLSPTPICVSWLISFNKYTIWRENPVNEYLWVLAQVYWTVKTFERSWKVDVGKKGWTRHAAPSSKITCLDHCRFLEGIELTWLVLEMNYRHIPRRCYQYVCDYNLFIREEDDYDDEKEGDGTPQELAILLRQQKYATWLYIILLISECFCLSQPKFSKYFLFNNISMSQNSRSETCTNTPLRTKSSWDSAKSAHLPFSGNDWL